MSAPERDAETRQARFPLHIATNWGEPISEREDAAQAIDACFKTAHVAWRSG